MSRRQEDKQALVDVLTPYFLAEGRHAVTRVVNALVRHSGALHRLHEMACNDPNYGPKEEKREARIMQLVQALLPASIKAEENGDPRGWSIILHLPDGKSNDFGGRGWGVPVPVWYSR